MATTAKWSARKVARGVGVNFPAVPIQSRAQSPRTDMRFAEQRKILISNRRPACAGVYLLRRRRVVYTRRRGSLVREPLSLSDTFDFLTVVVPARLVAPRRRLFLLPVYETLPGPGAHLSTTILPNASEEKSPLIKIHGSSDISSTTNFFDAQVTPGTFFLRYFNLPDFAIPTFRRNGKFCGKLPISMPNTRSLSRYIGDPFNFIARDTGR